MAPETVSKLDHIIHRERRVQKALQKTELDHKKHKYYIMEIPIAKVPDFISKYENLKSQRLASNAVTVRPYNHLDPKDNQIFTEIFNLILLTSPDPYRPLTVSDAEKFFKEGTFLAFLYGKCVGYGVLTIEKTDLGKIGVIAGIGVHPKFRRKKVAQKIAVELGKWFLEQKDLIKLQCEVYEDNLASQQFISSFGFQIVGTLFLD